MARCLLLIGVSLACLILVSCEATSKRGELTTVSEGWLIRPGSPAGYLKKQVGEIVPVASTSVSRDLFVRYDAQGGPTYWSPGWTATLDFTGIAWDNAKAGTLIHPQFVVFASHFQRRKGETLTFHERSGRAVKRKIARKAIIHRITNPDLTVAMLDRPVPSTITHYPIPPAGHDYRVLNGAPLLVTDKERKVHLFRINRVSQEGFEQLGARPALGHEFGAAFSERLERGDSGHPAFVVVQGKLVLASTLKGGGWASKGPFFGGDRIQRSLMAAMAKLRESS